MRVSICMRAFVFASVCIHVHLSLPLCWLMSASACVCIHLRACDCICMCLHSSACRILNVQMHLDANGSLVLDASFVQGLSIILVTHVSVAKSRTLWYRH